MPRLSVLLPVKDGVATIHRAVTSTLRAMPRDAELLVIDDGSTDGTGTAVAGVRDGRLRMIRHDRPRGVAESLNAGLRQTDSLYVARMDADDITLPWRFRLQLPAAARVDHVFGSLILIDRSGRPVGAADPAPVSPDQAPLHLLSENPFAHPTLVAQREALLRLDGYRPTAVEDYDLWLRAVSAGQRLRKLAAPVLAYRRHAGQVTGSWDRATEDLTLDAAYGALLPADLKAAAAGLRRAAVFRDPTAAAPQQVAELRRHVQQQAVGLDAASRRRLQRRLRRLQPSAAASE